MGKICPIKPCRLSHLVRSRSLSPSYSLIIQPRLPAWLTVEIRKSRSSVNQSPAEEPRVRGKNRFTLTLYPGVPLDSLRERGCFILISPAK